MDSSFFLTTVATAIGLVTLLSAFLITVAAAAIRLLTLLRKLKFHQDNEENVPSSSLSSSLSPVSVPPPSSPRIWTHDVFPSFRGEDVRKNFFSHVQMEFERKGINLFIDNGIKRGESIGSELIRAIRESKIAIILISRNYASSKWCLDELVEIMKCREELGQTVMAVFYEVNPSDVKKLAGDFGRVFRKTCAGKTKECIETWRQALAKVATIAGYHSINWDTEAAMIKTIATDVSNMLNKFTPSNDFEELVGMGAHLKKMEPLLRQDSDEVRMIGIWGPPGIGKTTIARFAYYQLSNRFQLSVFMDNLKANDSRLCSDDYSLKLQLQQLFMSQITNHKDMVVSHLGVVSNRLKDKKVLIVLDGVDKSVQLDAIAKETCWFGPGSRIIITTQDKRLFRAYGVNHIYEVDFPTSEEALQIFCTYCFGQKSPEDGFEELAREVTRLAGELPLGLKVMGSYFRGMSKQDWISSLPRLRTSLDANIRSILMFSYDALDNGDKKLFLYIACFFKSEEIHKVEGHLAKKFLDVRQRLKVLAERSLISITWGYIKMHSLLEKLGREIVCEQSIHEPGQRQFLNDKREICEVLTGDAIGSKSVIGINLEYGREEEEIDISEKAFKGMSNLQFLKVHGYRDSQQLTGGLDYLSHKLRLLHWRHFPSTCFPCNVNVEFLVELIMPNSKLEKLWGGIKSLRSLRWMDLSYSLNLKELPDLSTATNLEKLNLIDCSSLIKLPSLPGNSLEILNINGCSNLVEIPSFIGNATYLEELNLIDCSSLTKLPSLPENSLEILNINGCSNLVEFSSFIGNGVNLRKLYICGCLNLVELPDLSTATYLEELNLLNCSSLTKLPSLPENSLEILNINGCSNLVEFPSFIGNGVNLRKLDIRDCLNLVELPDFSTATNLGKMYLHNCSSIIKLPSLNGSSLEKLNIGGCSSLVEFSSFIGNAVKLQKLYLRNCWSLVELPDLSTATNLEQLNLDGCPSLIIPSLPGNSLGVLDIRGCSSLVKFPSFIGNAVKLRRLNLINCSKLVELPDLSTATYLEELALHDCSNLIKLPSLPGNSLGVLDISGCSSLVKFPSFIGNVVKLRRLNLSSCFNLVKLPDLSTATNLDKLNLFHCSSLIKFPSLPGNSLELLNINGCSSLVEFPSFIGNAVNLLKLNLGDCSSLINLPSLSGNSLELLNISGCSSLVELPSYIGNAVKLRSLDLSSLPNLLELPSFVGNATNLEELDVRYCSNLVELPQFLGNLQKLQRLILKGCSKLEVLPANINLESLNVLNLCDCSMLTRFPQISTNIIFLDLTGTAIEQVPPSIRSWPRLEELKMSYFENLKDFPHALERITELCLTDTEIQEVPPWVKKMSRLSQLVVKGCRKLVSLPPISESIRLMDASDCESLEMIECSFPNYPFLDLNFANCFKLNQEARDLIIKSNSGRAVLPGGKVPEYFTHRANGGGPLTIKLNEKPLPKSMTFKGCILLLSKGDHDACSKEKSTGVYVKLTGVHVADIFSIILLLPALAQHLYTFRIEAKVTSRELVFEFKLENDKGWKIGECGLVQDLEVPSC